MMKQSSLVKCRLNQGGSINVQLEERVEIDRSANQHESGWWVWVGSLEGSTFFLSDEGILYGLNVNADSWRETYDQPIGICVPMAKQAKAYDKMIEALYEDEGFSCGFQQSP